MHSWTHVNSDNYRNLQSWQNYVADMLTVFRQYGRNENDKAKKSLKYEDETRRSNSQLHQPNAYTDIVTLLLHYRDSESRLSRLVSEVVLELLQLVGCKDLLSVVVRLHKTF